MKKLTKEWLQKAESDYRAAAKLERGRGHFHDEVSFHCQQAAEKFLKALLEELGLTVPRTHLLTNLLNLLLPHYPSLRSLRRGLKFLTRFAIGPRYPGYSASKRQAQAALRWAGQVRDAVRPLLGIRQARKKKLP
jgi:HEPN domain-containing protein